MGRKNDSYVQRQAEAIREGDSPELNQEPESELDRPEVQAQILRPETIEIPLESGPLTVQKELKLKVLFHRKTTQIIQTMVMVIAKAVRELSGDHGTLDNEWFKRNGEYIPQVVYKDAVTNIVADFLGMITEKPASTYVGSITAGTVSATFMLAMEMVAEAAANKPKKTEV